MGKPKYIFVRCPYPAANADEAIDHFERHGSVIKTVLHMAEDGFMRGYALVIPRE